MKRVKISWQNSYFDDNPEKAIKILDKNPEIYISLQPEN